jgi:HEAT repeat protein
MIANRQGLTCLLIAGLVTVGLCGCDEKLPAMNPFYKAPAEEHGIITPAQRIRDLKELAKNAPQTTDPARRETICAELVVQIRKEPDSIMRSEILRTLAAYGGPTADEVLIAAMRDTDADVRVIVCNLWAKRADAEAAKVLANALASDSDRDVRMAAARGLGQSHGPVPAQALIKALDDTDPAMRHIAMVALHDSTGKDFGSNPGDKEQVARWQKFVKTGEEPQQSWAERIFPWLR